MSDKALVQTLDTHTATRAARANFAANIAALAQSQPTLNLGPMPEHDWGLARDGSLSCRIDGAWLAGCSVPADAAALQFDQQKHGKPFVGLSDPLTAHHVAAALATLKPGEALLAHFLDDAAARLAMSMANFAEHIAAGRLWLAIGPDWTTQLDAISAAHPGLPVLGEFIRQPQHADRYYEDLVEAVTPVVRASAVRSAELVAERRKQPKSTDYAVIAPTTWRDTDDAGHVLAGVVDGVLVDPDNPTQAARIAVQLAAAQARAIVAANLCRSDVPDGAAADQPWITWHTRGPVRPRANPIDRLLLADPADLDAARSVGWSDAAVATWPTLNLAPATNGHIALLADLPATDTEPDEVERYSGQRPLWEGVAQKLDANPFATAGDPYGFVDQLAARLGVARFARALLVETWVMPRILRGVVGTLRGAGLDIRQIAPESRADWLREAGSAAVLIDPAPTPRRTQLHATGRPVLSCLAAGREGLIADARRLLQVAPPQPAAPALSRALIEQLVQGGKGR